MSKPDDIPQDAWDAAFQHKNSVDYRNMSACEFVARAIMSAEKRGEERERAACEQVAATYGANMSIWLSSEWPTAKLASTYAGQDIAAAISKRGA